MLEVTRGDPPARPAWRGPFRVVSRMTTDRALLVARAGMVGVEAFVLLDTNLAPTALSGALTGMVLALARDDAVPALMIAEAAHTGLARALVEAARRIPGAIAYPHPDGNILPLRTASLARALADGLGLGPVTVLDTRPVASAHRAA
jgi:hypothetical protein